jgi:hypothetical protein
MQEYTVIFTARGISGSGSVAVKKVFITCSPSDIFDAIAEAGIDDSSVSFVFYGHCKDVE